MDAATSTEDVAPAKPAKPPKPTKLALDFLTLDPAIQMRAEVDAAVVDEYAEKVAAGVELPPVVVFCDESGSPTRYWLADGFQRVEAHKRAKRTGILCEVRKGTRRDAILFACSANSTHGRPRTIADKKRAVQTLLLDPEWTKKSDRWIADVARVSHVFVGKLRGLVLGGNVSTSEPRAVEGKDGTTYPVKPREPKQADPVAAQLEQAKPASEPLTPTEEAMVAASTVAMQERAAAPTPAQRFEAEQPELMAEFEAHAPAEDEEEEEEDVEGEARAAPSAMPSNLWPQFERAWLEWSWEERDEWALWAERLVMGARGSEITSEPRTADEIADRVRTYLGEVTTYWPDGASTESLVLHTNAWLNTMKRM
jgi:uncharacterized ParB-like nuclease family protein